MEIIKTIDLWTEQSDNHYECFNGAFVDGFSKNEIAFDEYKIVKNCNCIITTNNEKLNIRNKHNAIVFYKNLKPIRLMVINKETNIEKSIEIALNQFFEDGILNDVYNKFNIKSTIIDMNQTPIYNNSDSAKEIDVGSCDRWNLLYNMLKGTYTESDTVYGNFQNTNYEFIPNIKIKYELVTEKEKFEINHKCAFINELENRIIPIQENSPLTT